MSFPRFNIQQIDTPELLHEAIGIEVKEYYVDSKDGWNLAYVHPKGQLKTLKPDYEKIKQLIPKLLIVTTIDSENKFDFLVRCFAPNLGINEDPVTGAANCLLSTFWYSRLNREEFISKQMSQRTGIIKTRVNGSRVEISGQAKTIFKANLILD